MFIENGEIEIELHRNGIFVMSFLRNLPYFGEFKSTNILFLTELKKFRRHKTKLSCLPNPCSSVFICG